MSFREKSAWVMGAIMIATGLWYAQLVAAAPQAPVIGPLIPYVLAVVFLSIVAQVALAIASPKEADAPADTTFFKLSTDKLRPSALAEACCLSLCTAWGG